MANRVEFASSICKSAKVLVPVADIQFLHKTNKANVFGMRSPLTHQWQEFIISNEFQKANCVPKDVQDFVDYYELARMILDHCRSHSELGKDLQCLDEEESRIFGLRLPFHVMKKRARFA